MRSEGINGDERPLTLHTSYCSHTQREHRTNHIIGVVDLGRPVKLRRALGK